MKRVFGSGILLAVAGLLVGSASADSSLYLTGVAPNTGNLVVQGNALGMSGSLDVYAGLLGWSSTPTGVASLYTYCVDLQHDIGTGTPYKFIMSETLQSFFGTDSAIPAADRTQVANAIEWLWADESSDAAATTEMMNPNLVKNNTGAEAADQMNFQVAIWDLIANQGAAPSNSGLNFTDSAAVTLAQTAWGQAAGGAPSASVIPSLVVMQEDDGLGQSQVYIGPAGPSSSPTTPTPMAVVGGLGLLGILGAGKLAVRRRLPIAV